MSKITKKQIQLIHIAKNKLDMDDDTYRETLSSLYGATSSKALSYRQAADLIDRFKSFGFVIKSKKPDNIIRLASPKQRRLIEVLSQRFQWRVANGFMLWLQAQKEKGFIKSVEINESSDANWVIEKLKLMTGTSRDNISKRERPHAMG